MSVLNDTKIWEMIRSGMIDFAKSDTDPETVRAQVNPNTLDLTLGRYARLPLDPAAAVSSRSPNSPSY